MKKKQIIELRSHDGIEIPTFSIGNYISRLSSYHYKFEILMNLEKLFYSDKDLSTIFIMNNSFNPDYLNSFVSNLEFYNYNLYNLFNYGEILSILPNEKIIKINSINDILNKEFYSLETNSIKKWNYFKENFINLFKEESFIDAIYKRENKLNYNFLTKNSRQNYVDNSRRVINIYKDEMKIYNDSKISLTKDLSNQLAIRFKKKLSYLQRPIVGHFNKDLLEFEVFNTDLIRHSKIDNNYFELNEITKNSPFTLKFEGFNDLFKYIFNREGVNLENELILQNIEKSKLENKKLKNTIKHEKKLQEFELKEKQLDLYKKGFEFYNETNDSKIKNSKPFNNEILEYLEEAKNNILDKSLKVNDRSSLKIINIENKNQ